MTLFGSKEPKNRQKPNPLTVSIGIIGGAGPFAGISLVNQIFCLARDLHGCWKDEDFPKVTLISFPFADMLAEEIGVSQIQSELKACLTTLRLNGASVIAIACNTLHAFLDEEPRGDLLQLPQIAAEAISALDIPLVLSTSTSVRFGLYQSHFPCIYPDAVGQKEIDRIIVRILQGNETGGVLEDLQSFINAQSASTIVLGCTELSLYTNALLQCKKRIIDPLNLMARQIINKSFGEYYVNDYSSIN
jgi:aspartate racemase